jgi:hypothetical protein
MNRLRWRRDVILGFAVFLVLVVVLPSSGNEKRPRQIFAPKDTRVDKEQFSKAKLTFKDEVVKKDHVILEKGKEYEFSGSFELAKVDDEAGEHIEFLVQLQSSLGVLLVIDKVKSGYPPPEPEKAHIEQAWVLDTYAAKVPVNKIRFESPNIIHFSGNLKAPVQIGEQELRITFVPDSSDLYVTILSRLVEVVEPSTPKGN